MLGLCQMMGNSAIFLFLFFGSVSGLFIPFKHGIEGPRVLMLVFYDHAQVRCEARLE